MARWTIAGDPALVTRLCLALVRAIEAYCCPVLVECREGLSFRLFLPVAPDLERVGVIVKSAVTFEAFSA